MMNAPVTIEPFDYAAVPDAHRSEVKDAAMRIKLRMERTASDIIEIGRDLIAAKARLGHGNYLRWIGAEFGMSDQSAGNFVNVAKRFGEQIPNNLEFGPTVLYALAAPSTPDGIVSEVTERAAAGEKFTAADVKRMKDKWAAERKTLKDEVKSEKDKAKNAKASRAEYENQLSALQADINRLMDERNTLRWKLEHQAPVLDITPTKDAAPAKSVEIDDEETLTDEERRWRDDDIAAREEYDRQLKALRSAWADASPDVRSDFLMLDVNV